MGYLFNLKNISIDQYKEILKSSDLLPSWGVLKDNLNNNFSITKKENIQNLEELKYSLKERDIYKENIGERDMELCVEAAAMLDFEIQY